MECKVISSVLFTAVNSCQNVVCFNGGTCLDGPISFECQCAPGFTGDYCLTSTYTSGTCNRYALAYAVNDVFGLRVSISILQHFPITVSDIDDCISQPCWNGRCEDAVNGYTCDCDAGYTGVFCETSKALFTEEGTISYILYPI